MKTPLFAVVIAGLLLASVAAFAQQPPAPAAKPASSGERTLIVFDLMPEKNVDRPTTNLLTEIVLDKATKLKRYKVIGQKDLAKMLSWEQNKQLTGCSDTSCLVQIAGAMGAELYIEGSVGAVGDNYVITLKLIDAASVAVTERDTKVVPKNENVMVATVMQMVDALFKVAPTGQGQVSYAPMPQAPGGPYTPAAASPGFHRHDGLFLRLSFGFGFASTGASDAGTDMTIKGLAGVGDVAIGYSLIDNLSLSFDIFGPVLTNPTLESGGRSGVAGENVSVSWMGYGAGINYYLVPANVYFAVNGGASTMSLQVNNKPMGETGAGLILQAMIGKEWWVSENWGIGMAGNVIYSSIPEKSGSATWTGYAIGLLFSSTYN